MDTPEQHSAPPPALPSPAPVPHSERRRLGSLQGEDGYDIFTDDTPPDLRPREVEDNRW